MAFLTTRTLPQIQEEIRQGYATALNNPADTGVGSALGPLFNPVALAVYEQQLQAMYTANVARLATIPANADGTPNPDVDSYCIPFGLPRLGASAAQGYVTFSTASAVTSPVLVPLGAIVQTPNGLQFQVIADTGNGAYSPSSGGYPISSGTSVNATVQCLTLGSLGNVTAGQITQIYGGVGAVPLPGIATVTNPSSFAVASSGSVPAIDFESDAAYKARFTLAMSNRVANAGGAAGTYNDISAAILGVQPGLTYSIGDRINADGSSHVAYFTAVVAAKGATSSTPASLISAVTTALEGNPNALPTPIPQVRPEGISYQVIGPTIVTVDITAVLTMAPGGVSATVIAAALAAFNAYIASIGMDPKGLATLAQYGYVYAVLYAVPNVVKVEGLLLNGGSVDISAAFAHMLAPGSSPSITTA